MSEKSLWGLMLETVTSDHDVRDLGLGLGFSGCEVESYIRQDRTDPVTACYKILLEWRNSRVTGREEEKKKELHDVLVEMSKTIQAERFCTDSTCGYHKANDQGAGTM